MQCQGAREERRQSIPADPKRRKERMTRVLHDACLAPKHRPAVPRCREIPYSLALAPSAAEGSHWSVYRNDGRCAEAPGFGMADSLQAWLLPLPPALGCPAYYCLSRCRRPHLPAICPVGR